MTKSLGIRVKRGTRTQWAAEQQGRHHCACGCGELIAIRPEHYPHVPRFIHSHNSRLQQKKPAPERRPCACRCGLLAGPGKDYISGHNSSLHTLSDASREKLRQSQLARHRANPKPKRPQQPGTPCICGCGQLARPGRRYVTGHNSRGTRMANYRGWYRAEEYIWVHAEDHPYASSGYVREHRLVAEQHLRQTDPDSPCLVRLGNQLYLRPKVVVHHVDGVKDNNDASNLRVMSSDEHTRLHHDQGDIRQH